MLEDAFCSKKRGSLEPVIVGGHHVKNKLGVCGRITIPKRIRVEMGLIPGTVVDIVDESGSIVIRKADSDHVVEQVRGCLRLNRPTKNNNEESSGDV